MHEVVKFNPGSKYPVPEKFLRHLDITFSHDYLKGEDMNAKGIHGAHGRIDLASIQIQNIELVDAEYLIVTYKDRLFFDIFNLNGV